MFIEDESGVLVQNEEDLKAFCEFAGWENIEDFEKTFKIDRKEVYGRKFETIKDSLWFVDGERRKR